MNSALFTLAGMILTEITAGIFSNRQSLVYCSHALYSTLWWSIMPYRRCISFFHRQQNTAPVALWIARIFHTLTPNASSPLVDHSC
ncbi:MAG: hypothetical protein PHE86_01545 [Candidatus Marinimicrobia bacterium]|nr:hypothetical protein [Candidatus Neomarinimicrobiota bacterium]